MKAAKCSNALKGWSDIFLVRSVGLDDFLIEIMNEHFFISSKEYLISWKLRADGSTIQSGDLAGLIIKPQESKRIKVPVEEFKMEALTEYFLEIEFI